MMQLSGNKWMQKREVEKRMHLHWKNLDEKTSTGASRREESPRKSMLNRRKQNEKQREINEVKSFFLSVFISILFFSFVFE